MHVLFYLKQSKNPMSSMAYLYSRITINGKRSEISLKRKVDLKKWDTRKGKIIGNSETALQLNRHLDDVKRELYNIYDLLFKENSDVNPSRIKDLYIGNNSSEQMLLEIFENHNKEMESLIGKDYLKGTLQRYKVGKEYVNAAFVNTLFIARITLC